MNEALVYADEAGKGAAVFGEPHPTRELGEEAFSCEPPTLDILVVDDDTANYALIERCLRHMPRFEPRISLAGNLSAAEFAASAGRFDVILVDYSVGAGRGLDFVRSSVGRNCASAFVLVAGIVTNEVEAEALEAGAIACLSKNDLSAQLVETVLSQAIESKGNVCKATSFDKLKFSAWDGSAGAGAPLCKDIAQQRSDVAASLDSRVCVDVQALVVDAIGRARTQRTTSTCARRGIELQLQDRPVYVRADCRALLRTLDQALGSFGSQQLKVAVIPAGAFNEILFEPAQGCRPVDSGAMQRVGVEAAARHAEVREKGYGLSVILPAARRSLSGFK